MPHLPFRLPYGFAIVPKGQGLQADHHPKTPCPQPYDQHPSHQPRQLSGESRPAVFLPPHRRTRPPVPLVKPPGPEPIPDRLRTLRQPKQRPRHRVHIHRFPNHHPKLSHDHIMSQHPIILIHPGTDPCHFLHPLLNRTLQRPIHPPVPPSPATRKPGHHYHPQQPHRHLAPIPNTTHTSLHTPQKDALTAADHHIPHTPSPAPARTVPANVAPSVAVRTPRQAVPTACTLPCDL